MRKFKELLQPAYVRENRIDNAQAASFAVGVRKYTDVNTLRLESVIKTDLITLVRSTIPFQVKWNTLQFVANRMEDPADVFKLVVAYADRRRDQYGVDHMDLNGPVQFANPAYNYVTEPDHDAELALLETAFSRLSELDSKYQYKAAKIIYNHAPVSGELQKRVSLFIWQNCHEQDSTVLRDIMNTPTSPRVDEKIYGKTPDMPELSFTFGESVMNAGRRSFGRMIKLPEARSTLIFNAA